MAKFAVPAESKTYSTVVETFRGVDLNNSPANVDKSRSPSAPNMIRDQVGKVRKRTGYTTMVTAPGGAAINGVHHLLDEVLIHAGTKLYRLAVAAGGAWTTAPRCRWYPPTPPCPPSSSPAAPQAADRPIRG